MNQKDPTDINKAAGLSLVDDADKHHFSLLPVGQGIVKLQDRWRKPFLVQFPLVDVPKGMVTDAVLKRLLTKDSGLDFFRERGFSTRDLGSENRERRFGGSVDKRRFLLGDNSGGNSPFYLLEDVVRFPDDGVDQRYKRLRLSAEKGHEFKQELLDMALVTQESIHPSVEL